MGRPVLSAARSRAPNATRAWVARSFVFAALATTLVFAGPRALAVARSRLAALAVRAPSGPRVELDRVGFVHAPAWLRGELLRHVSTDLAAVLGGTVGLHDSADAERLLVALRAVPWVRDVELQRVYPDRLRTALTLRQPLVALETRAGRCFLDVDGIALPATPCVSLPAVLAGDAALPAYGAAHQDAAVGAAIAVAAEWVEQIVPKLTGIPELVAIDATNHGYARIAEGRWCEVRVGLRRADGGLAWLDYDHAPGSAAPRVDLATKVDVLARLLARFPGLAGVELADLRFPRRWENWVRLASPATAPPRAQVR